MRYLAGRQGIQGLPQTRLLQALSVDRDGHDALVETETVQHRSQAVYVAARATYQSERSHRGGLAQRHQFRGRLECRFQGTVVGADLDLVRLRVRRECR